MNLLLWMRRSADEEKLLLLQPPLQPPSSPLLQGAIQGSYTRELCSGPHLGGDVQLDEHGVNLIVHLPKLDRVYIQRGHDTADVAYD
jgi:hypothetical protein